MKIIIAGKSIEVNDEELAKAIEGKTDLKLESDLIIRTKDEQDKFINNTKPDIVNAALEMEVKKWRNDLGLDFEGKTHENLMEALKNKHKTEFTKEPSDQLEAKEKDILKLKETIQGLTGERDKVSTDFQGYKNESILNSELGKYLPNNLSMPKDDAILLLKARLSPSVENGKVVYKKDGEVMKDGTTLDPLGSENVMKDFFAENKHFVNGLDGGSGGGDSQQQTGASTLDVFNKRMEAEGFKVGSVEYNQQAIKAVESKELNPSDVK